MFWKLAMLAALSAGNYLGPANLGIPINVYSSDPVGRMERLLTDSEDFRQIHEEWRRFWVDDQPTPLTPYRIHGGVGPASSSI